MSTTPALPSIPHQSAFKANVKGDIAQVMFAGHNVAKLLVGDGRCVCGVLSGDSFEPSSHNNPECCPIAVFYQAVKDCEVK